MCLVKQQVPVPSYYSAIIYLKWLGYFPVPIHASLFLNLSFHLEAISGITPKTAMVITLTKAEEDILLPCKVILKLGLPQRTLRGW